MRAWPHWLLPLAAHKSLARTYFEKRTPAQPGTNARRMSAARTGEVQSSEGRAGRPCASTLTRLRALPFPRSCTKLRTERGLGPLTLRSLVRSPSCTPHPPLRAACASACHVAQSPAQRRMPDGQAFRFCGFAGEQIHECTWRCEATIRHPTGEAWPRSLNGGPEAGNLTVGP